MDSLLAAVDSRLGLEEAAGGAAVLARALDRLYRRLQASAAVLPEGDDYVRSVRLTQGTESAVSGALSRCQIVC